MNQVDEPLLESGDAIVEEELLTAEELASEWKVNRSTIWRLIRDRKLAAVKIGDSYRIARSDARRYLDAQRINTEEVINR